MAKTDTYLESQQDDAFEAARDAGAFEPDEGWADRRYNGSLIADCASLQEAAKAAVRPTIDLKAEILKVHNQFMALHGIKPMGDKEAACIP